MNIYQKLNAAREAFHSKEIKKTGLNSYAGYTYFELGDFIAPALQIFKEVGLIGLVSFGETSATLTVVNEDKPDETIVFTSPMSEANLKGCHAVQNLGAVQTYLRRYLWVTALEIVEHDALEVTTSKQPKTKIAALDGIGDLLTEETRQVLRDWAMEAIAICRKESPEAAKAFLQSKGAEDDERLYLDKQLPSDVRSAMRKVK